MDRLIFISVCLSHQDTSFEVLEFHLRDEAAAGERDLRNAVEDELETDVMKLDLREAAYIFAQQHPEEIAAILREWGYEYR